MSHTNGHVADRLDDWLDGALPPAEAAEVERHLAGCEECGAEAEALRSLLAEAAALPREVRPARDLWAGIAPRLEPRRGDGRDGRDTSGGVIPLFPRALRRRPVLMQAAAAVLLMLASSAGTALLLRPDTPVASAPSGGPVERTPTAFAAFRPAEREYDRAIADLTAVLESRRDRLAPETVEVLESNLRIIDQAIEEARDALAADPASAELAGMLDAAYETKVELLRRVVEI